MLPFFTTLVFGIIKFERVFLIMQLVTNAAREGCRRAVIDGSTNNEVTHYTQTFMQTSANVATAIRTVTVIVTPATGNTANPTSDLASSASRLGPRQDAYWLQRGAAHLGQIFVRQDAQRGSLHATRVTPGQRL